MKKDGFQVCRKNGSSNDKMAYFLGSANSERRISVRHADRYHTARYSNFQNHLLLTVASKLWSNIFLTN